MILNPLRYSANAACKVIIAVLMLAFSPDLLAQMLSPEQAKEDYGLFTKVLLYSHPKPYRFTDSATFAQQLSTYSGLLQDSLSALQLYHMVGATMSMIGESHSGADPGELVIPKDFHEIAVLPLELHFYQGEAFVRSSSTNPALEGARVLQINGLKMNEIIDRMDSLSTLASGNIKTGILRKLSYADNFAQAYYLFVGQSETFEVLLHLDGQKEMVLLNAQPLAHEFKLPLNPPEPDPPYSLIIDESRNVAVIKVSSFAFRIVGHKIKKYFEFYERSFEEIRQKGIDNLVIDMRDNRGGTETIGGELIRYLHTEPFVMSDHIFALSLDYPSLKGIKVDFERFKEKDYLKVDSGYLRVAHASTSEFSPHSSKHYAGQVYFLTNGNCFSACTIFMALVDHHDLGIIVGEETGGLYGGADGYARINLVLPNSGIEVYYPQWSLQTAVNQEIQDRGVQPDIEVQPTLEDVVNGRDALLQRVYDLIATKDKNR